MFLSITPSTQYVKAIAGAATLNGDGGVVTSEALTMGASGIYALALGNNQVTPNSVVMASVSNGTNSGGIPNIDRVTPGNGVVTIGVVNNGASIFNGTVKIAFVVFN